MEAGKGGDVHADYVVEDGNSADADHDNHEVEEVEMGDDREGRVGPALDKMGNTDDDVVVMDTSGSLLHVACLVFLCDDQTSDTIATRR